MKPALVATNTNGVAIFTYQGELPPDGYRVIKAAATATDPSGNTSEFFATLS